MVYLDSDRSDRWTSQCCDAKPEANTKRPQEIQATGHGHSSMISSNTRNNTKNYHQEHLIGIDSGPPKRLGQITRTNSSSSSRDSYKDTLKWWQRKRTHVALLGLAIAVVNCYAQATFCIAIVEMVLPADYVSPQLESSSALVGAAIAPPRPIFEANGTNKLPVLIEDQSCPIEFKYRNYYDGWRFESTDGELNNSTLNQPVVSQSQSSSGQHQLDTSNRFDWDSSQQGLLLGAFAIGMAPLQIIGGRLAEIYGSKWVLLLGCVGTGLTNLAIPHLAHFSFLLLLADRVLMGVAQAGMEPGLMCLLSDWLTPQEASFFISMLLFAMCLGVFLGSLCSGFILALGYGWPLTYYVCAALNLLVGLTWYVYADSWPRASKHISKEELLYIEAEQGKAAATANTPTETTHRKEALPMNSSDSFDLTDDCATTTTTTTASIDSNCKQSNISSADSSEQDLDKLRAAKVAEEPPQAPWLNILSSRAVWAFIICKISIRWCADVIANELPTYLANVLHLSIKINGLLNSASSVLFAISSFSAGWLASRLFAGIVSRANQYNRSASELNRSKTNLRKTFQSIASFGTAGCLMLMTRYDCDIPISMSCLLALSCFLVMGTGGELQIAYDMTSRYPGTLHGLACTLSVSGWLAPPLYGLVLGDQPSSRSRWSIVWYSTAAINLLGGLAFVLFADASPQDFDTPTKKKHNKDHHDHLDGRSSKQQEAPSDGGYINGTLNASSCESSPKSTHHHQSSADPIPSNNYNNKLNPLEDSMGFDCGKLIKCRQLESSFVQPKAFRMAGYCLDSPLRLEANDLIYPYDEKQTIQSPTGSQEAASNDNNNNNNNNNDSSRPNGSAWSWLANLTLRTDRVAKAAKGQIKDHWEVPPGSISGAANEPAIETVNQSGGFHDGGCRGTRFGHLGEKVGGSNGLVASPSEAEDRPSVGESEARRRRQTGGGGLSLAVHHHHHDELACESAATGPPAAAAYRAGAGGTEPKQGPLLTVTPAEAARQETITHL